MQDVAARGAGIIVLSSDLPELVGITDRILVFFRASSRANELSVVRVLQ